jgi:polar amino acid transport system permease protein
MVVLGLSSADVSQLASGLALSLKITGASLLLGYPLGILLALLSDSRILAIRALGATIVEVGRGLPALVLLYLIYYGLPSAGITLTAFLTSVLALGASTGAYTSEIFRASFRAIPKAQREAALALGLSPARTIRTVLLPQAWRIALPQLVSFAILVFQASALCFAVALPELLSAAYAIGAATFQYLNVLLITGAIYLAISLPASYLANRFGQERDR